MIAEQMNNIDIGALTQSLSNISAQANAESGSNAMFYIACGAMVVIPVVMVYSIKKGLELYDRYSTKKHQDNSSQRRGITYFY